MEKTQVTDLFRFVTVRGPQLISKERRNLGFIEHPNPDASFFLSLITGLENVEDARLVLSDNLDSYTPYLSIVEIKEDCGEYWEFSHWLSKNKDSINRVDIDTVAPSSAMDEQYIFKLWDTVFYEIIKKTNNPVRQACLEMIVTANFQARFTEYSPDPNASIEELISQEVLLNRLANAKIVLNKAFTVEKKKVQLSGLNRENDSFTKQEKYHSAKICSLKLDPMDAISAEICNLYKTYRTEHDSAFNTAYQLYQTRMESDVNTYLDENPEIANQPDVESLLPSSLGGKFNFSFADPMSPEYYSSKLSERAISYIGTNCTEALNVRDVINKLEEDKKECKKVRSHSRQRRVSEILINGVLLRGDLTSPKHFSLSFNDSPTEAGSVVAYFSLGIGYNGAYFTESSFELTIDGQTYTNTQPILVSNDDFAMFLQLFPTSTLIIPANKSFVFKGDFTLNNGKVMRIRKNGHTSSNITSGIAFYYSEASSEDILYGVNRIGVADFRKVEQELCCYVPGEVSHIENIMAKEYKEKSTRNYISTEVSTETSQEREMEELNENTSTTRNEMSSEIASVIESDKSKSFGVSATASGGVPKATQWGVDANMEMSFNKSTSDSNTKAKSFAEDLTRRALERIVQKTSVKRTSKMIRQFEENNKHGFDNREGVNHVTGVYRWINKVYKNRIVNYGKRLMYEFMVPEPSRFYKEAIIIKAEQEDMSGQGNGAVGDANVAVKPIHPRDNKITSPKDITRSNYSALAALYNITPEAPTEQFSTISDTFAEAFGNGDSVQSYNYPQRLSVPEMYEAIALTGPVSLNFKARTGDSAYLTINTASKSWQKADLTGESSASGNINHALDKLTSYINVSVTSKKIKSWNASIQVKCQLKESIFNDWQQGIFDDIMSAYNQQLQDFNSAQSSNENTSAVDEAAKEDKTIERNPLFNAEIVKVELKRLCIEMLTTPFGIKQGMDFYEGGECDVPKLKLGEDLDSYAAVVKFFEQAFDWDIMAQMFYPYYWAKKCDWKALFQAQDGVDYNFQAFLQSGMGRVVVPVRQGFEDAVTFFMETGEIWNGIGMAIETDDELYLSIMDECTHVEGRIEGQEWNTIVPSSLVIVQAESVKLDESGLPCCEDGTAVELNLLPDSNTLALQTPSA